MKKEFVVSKIETPEDGSHYIYLVLTDTRGNYNPIRRNQGIPENHFGIATIPITSLEDLKNLPKKISEAINGALASGSNSKPSDSVVFKLSEREYQELDIRMGDKVTLEIKISGSTNI